MIPPTTEEDRFTTHTRHASLGTAVQFAKDRLEKNARSTGYEFLVTDTWVMSVRMAADQSTYFVEAAATYAKIILATQPDDEDGAEEGPETDAPYAPPKVNLHLGAAGTPDPDPDDEYAEHDRRKAAELGMSVESYKRGVEDR